MIFCARFLFCWLFFIKCLIIACQVSSPNCNWLLLHSATITFLLLRTVSGCTAHIEKERKKEREKNLTELTECRKMHRRIPAGLSERSFVTIAAIACSDPPRLKFDTGKILNIKLRKRFRPPTWCNFCTAKRKVVFFVNVCVEKKISGWPGSLPLCRAVHAAVVRHCRGVFFHCIQLWLKTVY